MRLFWKLFLRIKGWKTIGEVHNEIKKSIYIVAPHTSNWDFIYGLAFRSTERINAKFLGKKELFNFPYGFIFRWLGGHPVDRGKAGNLVQATIDIFNSKDQFIIALAPEGTRRKVDKFKSGFYHIASRAKIPILMAALDYENKAAVFAEPFYPTGDQDADFKYIYNFFRNVKGKNPQNGLMHIE